MGTDPTISKFTESERRMGWIEEPIESNQSAVIYSPHYSDRPFVREYSGSRSHSSRDFGSDN